MPIRHTLICQTGDFKFSESYIDNLNSSVGTDSAIQRAKNLAQTRANTFGKGPYIKAVRLSGLTANRNTFYVVNEDADPSVWSRTSAVIGQIAALGGGDAARTSLKVRMDAGGSHSAIRYLAGLSDATFQGPDGFVFGGVTGGDLKSWNAWKSFITDGTWGIMVTSSKVAQQRKAISAWVFDNLGRPVITCAGLGAVVGQTITISSATFDPKQNFNGRYKVVSVTNNDYTCIPAVRTLPNTAYLGGGTARIPDSFFAAFSAITPLASTGHKRGNRGFFAPHGRQKTRS